MADNSMNFTPEQEKAITENFPGNALVSASAGSGKTRVLVQRVLNKVEHGVDVDHLLIVTFTKAAAKEMRDRIKKGLQDEVNQSNDDEQKRNLVKQIRKLSVAHISTMDAFCQWLVQKDYYAIDLDPNFRILADKTEQEMLRDSVWEDVREDLYGNDEDGSFARLTRNFSNDRGDDGLTDVVLSLYDFSNANQDPKAWLNHLVDLYQMDDNITQSNFYQKYLLPEIQNKIKQAIGIFKQAKQEFLDGALSSRADLIDKDIKKLNRIYDRLGTATWDALYELFNPFKLESMNQKGISKKVDDSQKEFQKVAMSSRTNAKKIIDKIGSKYFFAKEDANLDVIKQAEKLVQKLVEVVQTFSKRYAAVKKQKHAYEFVDIEHFALNILTGKSEDSKEIKRQLQNYFDEIMVDEYQDNNRLQDAILNAMKNQQHENMFMVGDVKQSIYGFRLADPGMFLEKLDHYQESDNKDTAVELSDNFRSVKNVDDFTNLVFSQIMDRGLGEMDYTGNAKLKYGATYYGNSVKSSANVMMYVDDNSKDDDENLTLKPDTNSEGQVRMVADQIQDLIQKKMQIYDKTTHEMRDIRYGDIAILEPTRNNNLNLSKEFLQKRIPLSIDGGESYFKTTEVQIMMSLLQIIDNPYQDIPLAAVLRSPIVGMDENEMAYLRINHKTGNYFASILDFYHHYPSQEPNEFGNLVAKKVQLFLDQLKDFKDFATKHELSDLIWHIYSVTGFLDYVGGMPAGKKRQANLHALYERASEYEKSSFKGLFAFVQFVKRLQDKDDDLAEAPADIETDSVHVMTIHGSKGLEFPVVFLMDATKNFNESAEKNRYVLNNKLGIGIKYFDQSKHELLPTLQYVAIMAAKKNSNLAEEMRKLYVALTRAEQQLYITGIVKKNHTPETETKDWERAYQSPNMVLDQSMRSGAKSFMDWIGASLVRHPNYYQDRGKVDATHVLSKDPTNFKVEFVTAKDLQQPGQAGTTSTSSDQTLKTEQIDQSQIQHIMDFKYPYHAATTTTAYQSVSEIKRLFDDPDNIQLGSVSESRNMILRRTRYNNTTFMQPQFMQSVGQPNSMEIGTATHLILQKINVKEPINQDTVAELLAQLVNDKLITPEVAKKVNVDSVVKFYQSDLGQLIKAHPDRLHREVPFSLLISAEQIFSEFENDADQKLLVHGIIDGYLDLDDGPVLFDYKTDFVNPKKPDASVEKIIDQYRGQVNIYGIALSDILGKPVKDEYLYLLSNNSLQRVVPKK